MLRQYLLRSLPKSQWGAITVAATVALIVIGWRWTQHRQAAASIVIPASVVVEILGDVHHPGTFILGSPVTASQALDSAGGCRAEPKSPPITPIVGDTQLKSGQRLNIACTGGGNPKMVIEPMSAAALLTLGLRLNLNKASLGDLTLIPGMKPHWAEAIVSRRNRQLWRQLDDLQEIPGVGPRTVAKWTSFLDLGEEGDLP